MRNNGPDTPLVLEVKGNSLDDGPGIRSVIFFKGCPLSCFWCHNPECKKAVAEIAFDARKCVGCGTCRERCEEDALSAEDVFYVVRSKCSLCFRCVETCPSGALEQVGKPMSTAELLEKVLQDKPFYDESGGGVTLSGGEPTLFMDFASRFAASLQQHSIHVLLETCGHFDLSEFVVSLYPHLDIIYFDIKIMDDNEHKKHCGTFNKKILENFLELWQIANRDGKELLPRMPLIPGVTDTDTNLEQTSPFLQESGVGRVALLAHNPLWHEKINKMGLDDPYGGNDAMRAFSSEDELGRCKAHFREAGIWVVDA